MKFTPCGESSTSRSVFVPLRHFFQVLGSWPAATVVVVIKVIIMISIVFKAYYVPGTLLSAGMQDLIQSSQ